VVERVAESSGGLADVLPTEEIRLLHRHGDDWEEMQPAHHAPADHDIERQLLKGGRLYRCPSCEAEFRVVGPDIED
jgi:hypothetical protein